VDYKEGAVITSPPWSREERHHRLRRGRVRGSRRPAGVRRGQRGLVWRTYLVPGPGSPATTPGRVTRGRRAAGPPGRLDRTIRSRTSSFTARAIRAPGMPPWRGPEQERLRGLLRPVHVVVRRASTPTPARSCGTTSRTPHDAWDYDGVNELLVADLTLQGQKTPSSSGRSERLLLRHQRQTGKLISAKAFQYITWASGST